MSRIINESCTLQLDEVLLTVRLRSDSAPSAAHNEASTHREDRTSSPAKGFFDLDDNPSKITMGIAFIAGGIESVLQKLKIQVQYLVSLKL